MSFAVVHMQKITKGGLRGIQSHNQREKEPRTNPDVDKERLHLNYTVHDTGDKVNYHKAVKTALDISYNGDKTIRKDAVMMCSFIVTSDTEYFRGLSEERQEQFFRDSYYFFAKRYGVENIVNANVHMDEKTPHMHLGVVPITADGRLSAKTLFDRKELISLQSDFVREVGAGYGLQRGVEGSPDKHVAPLRHKAEIAKQEQAQAEREAVVIRNRNETVKKEITDKVQKANEVISKAQETQRILPDLEAQRNALERKIEGLQRELKELESKLLTTKEVNAIDGKKGFLSDKVKDITYDEYYNLKKTAQKVDEVLKLEKGLDVKAKKLDEQATSIDRERDEVRRLPMEQQIERARLHGRVKELEIAFERLPPQIQEQLFPKKDKSKGFNHDGR